MRHSAAALRLTQRVALATAAMISFGVAGSAQAALFGDDEARKAILELRARNAEQDKRIQERLDTLNADLTRRLETAQRSQLELVNQIEALRQEVARLRGQNDILTNELAGLQKRNRELYGDLDTRLKSLEPKPVTLDGRAVTIGRDEQGAYDAALVLFRAGDFQGAIRSLQTFLVRYPQSAYVPWQCALRAQGLPQRHHRPAGGDGALCRYAARSRGAAEHRREPGRAEATHGRTHHAAAPAQGVPRERIGQARQGASGRPRYALTGTLRIAVVTRP